MSYDASADRETDAVARIFVARIQAFKDAEDFFRIHGIESNAVIGDGEQPVRAFAEGGNANIRWLIRVPVLNGIADQILKELHQMRLVHSQIRKRTGLQYVTVFTNTSTKLSTNQRGLLPFCQ